MIIENGIKIQIRITIRISERNRNRKRIGKNTWRQLTIRNGTPSPARVSHPPPCLVPDPHPNLNPVHNPPSASVIHATPKP
jgi:hypothetical protein